MKLEMTLTGKVLTFLENFPRQTTQQIVDGIEHIHGAEESFEDVQDELIHQANGGKIEFFVSSLGLHVWQLVAKESGAGRLNLDMPIDMSLNDQIALIDAEPGALAQKIISRRHVALEERARGGGVSPEVMMQFEDWKDALDAADIDDDFLESLGEPTLPEQKRVIKKMKREGGK
jgi:hypothetical protein